MYRVDKDRYRDKFKVSAILWMVCVPSLIILIAAMEKLLLFYQHEQLVFFSCLQTFDVRWIRQKTVLWPQMIIKFLGRELVEYLSSILSVCPPCAIYLTIFASVGVDQQSSHCYRSQCDNRHNCVTDTHICVCTHLDEPSTRGHLKVTYYILSYLFDTSNLNFAVVEHLFPWVHRTATSCIHVLDDLIQEWKA